MKKNHWLARLAGLLLVSYALLTLSVMAAGTAGSQSDPLVTLSYLNETFMSQLMASMDEKLEARDRELTQKLNQEVQNGLRTMPGQGDATSVNEETFTVVALPAGQTLYGSAGTEVLLRTGTAVCVAPSAPGLVDETDGSVLDGGAELAANHLYLMTDAERGVRAGADAVLLIRGGHHLG